MSITAFIFTVAFMIILGGCSGEVHSVADVPEGQQKEIGEIIDHFGQSDVIEYENLAMKLRDYVLMQVIPGLEDLHPTISTQAQSPEQRSIFTQFFADNQSVESNDNILSLGFTYKKDGSTKRCFSLVNWPEEVRYSWAGSASRAIGSEIWWFGHMAEDGFNIARVKVPYRFGFVYINIKWKSTGAL